MRAHLLSGFLVWLHICGSSVAKNECILDIDGKVNYLKRWPLIFKPNGELYEAARIADKLSIELQNGDEVLISCAPNYIRNFKNNRIEQVLGSYQNCTFQLKDGEEQLNDAGCDLRVIEEVLIHQPDCGGNTAVHFGFVHPIEQKSLIIGEACYDEAEGRTIYAHVKLSAKATYLQSSPNNYLKVGKHPDGRYKIELFRGLHFDEIYARLQKAIGQLPPMLKLTNLINDDLLSNGQFQEVRKLGWNYVLIPDELTTFDALRRDIKIFSQQQELDVYVGVYGVEKFAADVPLYLHEHGARKRFPMPAAIWLLVKNGERVTAFVLANNLVAATGNTAQLNVNVCAESNCEKISWLSADSRQVAGLVCCEYEQLKNALPNVLPKLKNVKGLLM